MARAVHCVSQWLLYDNAGHHGVVTASHDVGTITAETQDIAPRYTIFCACLQKCIKDIFGTGSVHGLCSVVVGLGVLDSGDPHSKCYLLHNRNIR